MANSKYEYVKSFEVEDEVMPPNFIVVRIVGRDFRRFSEVHEFEKPNDEKALKLMNQCAIAVLEEFPDVVFSYGYGDEYSFVLRKTSKFYQRRSSKISSVIVSFFSSVYVTKWKEFFPLNELRYPPSFHSRIVCCASIEVIQAYIAWRQKDCHVQNQYNTCFWCLVTKGGKTVMEAQEILKDAKEHDRNELLHQQFHINYNDFNPLFRQGTCFFRTKVEDVVKYNEDGTSVKRLRRKASDFRSENIAGRKFWNEHATLLKELGGFPEDCIKVNLDYIRSFQFESKLMPSTWIVIRIDGCHFHRFSEIHEFDKPNDKQALDLMNLCAAAVLKEFQDIIFSYGVSDEYSFVLKKDSQLYQRRASEIVSAIVSFFSSMYVMKWKDVFPEKELKYPPYFDGRAVCYPSNEILRDYLAWRQVDCHINNQYNTCFWNLVKSGKSKSEAQSYLKGTQAREKNELLHKEFGIDYNMLPLMFRQGSSVFRVETENSSIMENDNSVGKAQTKIVTEYCNIIEQTFWEAHPHLGLAATRCP
ncbi:tRNAHis guanylyltransferase Thg1 [Corchorus capsularis]|uniref:tRNA(His) guanylyltransferase n=1 Tax=Corchorus capsularis TaxID=210143 RepID=A0A1R3HXJ5_COCAP|nr:tRNAHis guanylyltransferase Thg1 [Corchorus capsularis]